MVWIQLKLEAYYTFNDTFAKIRSKRIRKVIRDCMDTKNFREWKILQPTFYENGLHTCICVW